MNIVHWGKFYHPDVGGVESVTRSLALGEADAGHDVTVICFRKTRDDLAVTNDGDVRVIKDLMAANVRSQPLGVGYLMTLIRSARRADCLQVHVPNMLAAFATMFVGRRARLIVHWHSDVVGKGLLGRVLMPVERRMLERADCIVATSQRYAEGSPSLRAHLSRVRIVPIGVADHGAAPSEGADALPDDLVTWLGDSSVIVSIGRLVPYKGFDILIEATRHIHLAKVVIVGKGPLEATLRENVKALGLEAEVYVAGFLSTDALCALLRRASLYCLPSVERSEAFGVVLPEAMSYGLPIVATDIAGSGVPWVNEHGVSGINVPVGDAVALAEACNMILNDEELRHRLSEGSRRRFEAEFYEAKSVARMIAVFDDLVDLP